MSKLIDLTGQRFGRLTVLKIAKKVRRTYYYLCKCDCGNLKVVRGSHLKSGKIQSCRCLQKEKAKELATEHGLSKTKLAKIWDGIKERCYNPNCKSYKNYGARGIKMCSEWKFNFIAFYKWAMENGYKEGLSIDRINVNGHYEPFNCRWITHKEQMNNTRINVYITFNNETHTLQEWSEITGISYSALRYRKNHHWSVEKMFSEKEQNLITFNGESHTIREWAKILNIKRETLKSRLTYGWSIEKAFTTPKLNSQNQE